ncbi:hypothetical protein QJS04_geneDACA017622 [Acorus gramineus]|uniref:Uncharacterized protein n=1 Tax=Acorus gramineus TaxID=55184 RepID=A0AAV9AZN1_ACOGR|nr:hypothetical protein QJS04_geneDACA017622 [Acorus gramineus]
MGSYISCTYYPTNKPKHTKVVLPSGEVRRFDHPTTAADLMLDFPGHFVAAAAGGSLVVGRRFSPVTADEELEVGEVYVMFPMRRVDSVVTDADVGRLLLAVAASPPRGARVGPEAAAVAAEEEVGPAVALEGAEFKYRLSLCRSRKPSLETIVEETACLR